MLNQTASRAPQNVMMTMMHATIKTDKKLRRVVITQGGHVKCPHRRQLGAKDAKAHDPHGSRRPEPTDVLNRLFALRPSIETLAEDGSARSARIRTSRPRLSTTSEPRSCRLARHDVEESRVVPKRAEQASP